MRAIAVRCARLSALAILAGAVWRCGLTRLSGLPGPIWRPGLTLLAVLPLVAALLRVVLPLTGLLLTRLTLTRLRLSRLTLARLTRRATLVVAVQVRVGAP